MSKSKRPRQHRETEDYIRFAARMLRAAGRRVADGDEVELRLLLDLHAVLDEAAVAGVAGLRARGMSWAYIASATGVTRQTAQERWGAKVAALELAA